MSALFLFKLALLASFLASVLYVHYRGSARLGLRRQLTDHSTFLAPYNALIHLFSGVPLRPILETKDFPELDRLRANWTVFRDEAARLYEAGHIRPSEDHDDLGFNTFFRKGWKRFYLKWYGAALPSAEELCPQSVALLRSVPTVHGAMFALIGPGGKVGPHRDPFAGSIRYHLGLITPNSDACRIFVDGHEYSWRDGKDLVFDETYVHWFENLTDQTRIILFCDVERPIPNRIVRRLNRFAIDHVVGLTASKNVEGEAIGVANRVFRFVYRARGPLKRMKTANRTLYYGVKYGLILLALYAFLFAGVAATH